MTKAKAISRRALMGNAGAMAAAAALSASGVSRQSSIARGPRAIALIGDRAHNADYIRVSLNRLFTELTIPIDYTTNFYDLSANLLKPYQLFVCFRDSLEPAIDPERIGLPVGGPSWISEEQGKAVQDFVSAGNGLYALHNSCDISNGSKNYREVMGGAYNGHPALRPFKVWIVNKDHPVTQGVEDFMVTDEQHYPFFDKDPKYLLLRGENIDGLTYGHGQENLGTTSNSGWAYEYGQGRVVFTAMGHTNHVMWQPEYLKMQKNAVRWLLKMT
jgi:type 1 glutamine amidotransferase